MLDCYLQSGLLYLITFVGAVTSTPVHGEKEIYCVLERGYWNYLDQTFFTCVIETQSIDDQGFKVLLPGGRHFSGDIKGFFVDANAKAKFLPENLAETFPNLIAFEVGNNTLETVSTKALRKLTNLIILTLAQNNIDTIEDGAFEYLESLEVLDLTNNKIKHIDRDTFNSLQKLTILYVTGNRIKFLNENIFACLENLKVISFAHNKLRSLRKRLFDNNKNLEVIRFEGNNLDHISLQPFGNKKALKKVQFEGNKCIDNNYSGDNLAEFRSDLRLNCSKPRFVKGQIRKVVT